MASQSLHVSEHIERPVADVYAYASDPANLPEWASGLSGSIEQVDGAWVAESPMGQITVAFAEANQFGVLDHRVTLADGTTFDNPMRVIAADGGSEVVFTLRRQPEMSDADFAKDADTIGADLATLKRLLEAR